MLEPSVATATKATWTGNKSATHNARHCWALALRLGCPAAIKTQCSPNHTRDLSLFNNQGASHSCAQNQCRCKEQCCGPQTPEASKPVSATMAAELCPCASHPKVVDGSKMPPAAMHCCVRLASLSTVIVFVRQSLLFFCQSVSHGHDTPQSDLFSRQTLPARAVSQTTSQHKQAHPAQAAPGAAASAPHTASLLLQCEEQVDQA